MTEPQTVSIETDPAAIPLMVSDGPPAAFVFSQPQDHADASLGSKSGASLSLPSGVVDEILGHHYAMTSNNNETSTELNLSGRGPHTGAELLASSQKDHPLAGAGDASLYAQMSPTAGNTHLEIESDVGDSTEDEATAKETTPLVEKEQEQQTQLTPPDSQAPQVKVEALSTDAAAMRNLYVANLPTSVDSAKLRSIFEPFGKVNDVKLLLDIATGTSRGIGFIMYEKPEDAKEAINKVHRYPVDGRLLQVRFAEKFADKKHEKVVGNIVYIRNIPATSGKESIRTYFSQYGEVKDVEHHPQSAELRGPSPYNMTFVTFQDNAAAAAAVQAVDGKAAFPLPQANHPFLVAKVIQDLVAEKRKSVILRPRYQQQQPQPGSSAGSPQQAGIPTSSPQQGTTPNPAPLPSFAPGVAPAAGFMPMDPVQHQQLLAASLGGSSGRLQSSASAPAGIQFVSPMGCGPASSGFDSASSTLRTSTTNSSQVMTPMGNTLLSNSLSASPPPGSVGQVPIPAGMMIPNQPMMAGLPIQPGLTGQMLQPMPQQQPLMQPQQRQFAPSMQPQTHMVSVPQSQQPLMQQPQYFQRSDGVIVQSQPQQQPFATTQPLMQPVQAGGGLAPQQPQHLMPQQQQRGWHPQVLMVPPNSGVAPQPPNAGAGPGQTQPQPVPGPAVAAGGFSQVTPMRSTQIVMPNP